MQRVWSLSAAAVVAGLIGYAGADEPARKYRVVSPKGVGIIATGINDRGEIVGFEWVEDPKRPGVLEQKPFFARGKEITYLPLLKGYTATFPGAVSDDGVVVGRVSKPAPPGAARIPLRNQAFVWDAKGGIRGLGVLRDDYSSFAGGISRDGRRISGYSVGDNRIRACVWDKDGDGWKGTPLPQTAQLGSSTVVISRDGKHVAATDGTTPCLWTRSDAGEWTREVIAGPGTLMPRGVNDAGTVAGLRYAGDGRPHAAVWSRADGYKELKEPPGYVRSEANAVNNLGDVVGMVDGPPGSDTGPNAFIYEKGRLRLLFDEADSLFDTATAINDHREVAGVLEEKEK
jgi:uncharacterized membrane protein